MSLEYLIILSFCHVAILCSIVHIYIVRNVSYLHVRSVYTGHSVGRLSEENDQPTGVGSKGEVRDERRIHPWGRVKTIFASGNDCVLTSVKRNNTSNTNCVAVASLISNWFSNDFRNKLSDHFSIRANINSSYARSPSIDLSIEMKRSDE